MYESLRRAETLGETSVALLGSPAFYGRFGFRVAAEQGVVAPDPAWGEHFMIRAIGGAEVPAGTFEYAEPFASL